MFSIAKGTYRFVLLTSAWAIKFPRLAEFASGLHCNRSEREIWYKWRCKHKWPYLCPITFADPFGLIVIMLRAGGDVSADQIASAQEPYYYPAAVPEQKPEDWGILDGCAVCFDYGTSDPDEWAENRKTFEEKDGR